MGPEQKRWMAALFTTVGALVTLLACLLRPSLHDLAPFRLADGRVEGCLRCHAFYGVPSASHAQALLGCSGCHRGNPWAAEADAAHTGLVRNPADLRHAPRLCGRAGCHPGEVARVRDSLMATNRGITASLALRWGVAGDPDAGAATVPEVLAHDPPRRPPHLDYFAKLCGGCHLWLVKGSAPAPFAERGGGCVACHGVPGGAGRHSRFTLAIPDANCNRCHERSGRVGLAYRGVAECGADADPQLCSLGLSGGRRARPAPADVHAKAGMACVDCHTANGTMGRLGAPPALHARDQVDISCSDCHGDGRGDGQDRGPQWITLADPSEPAVRRARLLPALPPLPLGAPVVATARGGSVLEHVRPSPLPPGVVVFAKSSGRALLARPALPAPYHRAPVHAALDCATCHAQWVHRCDGCHVDREPDAGQYDWLQARPTAGRWRETAGTTAIGPPTLGRDAAGRIVASVPGMQLRLGRNARASGGSGAALAAPGTLQVTFAPLEPHTTARAARPCAECHGNPLVLGLGAGQIALAPRHGSGYAFTPALRAAGPVDPQALPPDAWTTPTGPVAFVPARRGHRPLLPAELDRIVAATACLPCHDRPDDPLLMDFFGASLQYLVRPELPCRTAAGPDPPARIAPLRPVSP